MIKSTLIEKQIINKINLFYSKFNKYEMSNNK